ncbi:mannitol dehydrogenase family protein [Thalassospira marina]|uniref:D-mannonate oxidoreductase n=1 Tax=Thalassospira marina TaxID=2048283 RepID=A0A2N3KTP7_9PROT|nr:mannitol dehydrogenase family protein [Thalassospira marina]PKR53959.1 D-mannonate oxidoreductase [Thalassospira marina]
MTVSSRPAGNGWPENPLATAGNGIVHIGVGAFHRAHQAVYTQNAMLAAGGDWRIIGVTPRSTDIADQLNAQDGAFCVIVRNPAGDECHTIHSISHVLAAARDLDAVLDALCDPAIRIVTLTVTEKAYGIDRQAMKVAIDHPAIAHDLAHPGQPGGVIGILTEALRRRRELGHAPFTCLCCDNLPENGAVLRAGMVDFARRIDASLGEWIAQNVHFPSSMVDRITPASTDATYETVHAMTGHDDACAVETEPFSQWVVEDDFPTGRPAWEQAGVLMVDDVRPYEHMKLRMLNGSHSLIAYLGQLAGYKYVRDVMADDACAKLVRMHMGAAAATLSPLAELDFADYANDLVTRFCNPAIAHETRQIAMDGTEKLPQRLLAPALEAINAGADISSFALAVAMWMAYAHKLVANGQGDAISDPRRDEIVVALGGKNEAVAIYTSLSALPGLFAQDLLDHAPWQQAVTHWLDVILREGVLAAVGKQIAR